MELFFFYWLTIIAIGILLAGILSKLHTGGLIALAGTIFLVTGLILIGDGLDVPEKQNYKIVKTGSQWDVNAISPVSYASVVGSPVWIIQMIYVFVFGIGLIIIGIWRSAMHTPEDDSEGY